MELVMDTFASMSIDAPVVKLRASDLLKLAQDCQRYVQVTSCLGCISIFILTIGLWITHMIFPKSWKPINIPDLIRVGPQDDGGYCTSRAAIASSSRLISFGLNDDWSFEEDFLKIKNVPVDCYDHSVNSRFWRIHFVKSLLTGRFGKLNKSIKYRKFFDRHSVTHHARKIGYDLDNGISLNTIMSSAGFGEIFLKIDIEGGEYRILDQIVEHQHRFPAILMELHDIDIHEDRIREFIRQLKSHAIVWMNGNNYGDQTPDGNPVVIEVSFVRSDFIDAAAASDAREDITYVNNPAAPPIAIKFEA